MAPRHLEWLAGLKPGDKVIITSHFSRGTIAVVKRVTKTRVITQHMRSMERAWRLKDSFEVGSISMGFDRTCIIEATRSEVERIEHVQRVDRIVERFNHTDTGNRHEIAMVKQITKLLDAERKLTSKGR